MALEEYNRKRNFAVTPEPKGKPVRERAGKSQVARRGKDKQPGTAYLIQKHAASHLHYDFRLELDGVLKSWAIPKGPSLDPTTKRLAMETEDHPLEYGSFEGIIPAGEYGGGTVMLWDTGRWSPVEGEDPAAAYRAGALKFELAGEKLRGRWALVRIKSKAARDGKKAPWLLIKERDAEARAAKQAEVVDELPDSAVSGRSLEEIAAAKDAAWHSNRRSTSPASSSSSSSSPQVDSRSALQPDRVVATTSRSAPTRMARKRTAASAAAPIVFVAPQLATLVSAPPEGELWLHEVKFDGFRILGRVDAGAVTLFTRTGQDWTARFSEVAAALAELNLEGTLLDGEVAVLRPNGTTSFQALQNHLQGDGKGALTYFVFDLLFHEGVDVRARTLEERKAALAKLLPSGPKDVIRYTDHVVANGAAFFQKAGEVGLEGIVSKKRDQPYRSGRSPSWLKTKAIQRQELVIGGFTEPEGARTGLGALLVGFRRDGDLVYAGKVGTGFTQKSARELRAKLDSIATERSPFHAPVKGAGRQLRWVQPQLVAEIAFTEMTSDGKLRHPSFQGLREDKPAEDVVQERPADLGEGAEPKGGGAGSAPNRGKRGRDEETIAGVKLTHPERLLEESAGFTKRDLARYYERIGPKILPHLAGRPLSLVRCPEGASGKCFFMKHAAFATPDLRRITIQEKEEKGDYLIVDSLAGLVGLAQMSVLEIHTWNSVDETLEQPDRVVFDFDPGPEAKWADVVRGAMLVKERVEKLGGTPFVKTTGGKGLHVVLPLVPNASWDECKVFSQLVSESVVAAAPKVFTTAMRKAGRERKVLIDYFRNNRGSTSVSVFSTRARPGMPVSLPIAWDEIAAFKPKRPFTMAAAIAHAAAKDPDPWADYESSRIDLKSAILSAG